MSICRYQSFDEPSDPATVAPRIAALRAQMITQGLDGFVIPRADEHQGEYVPAHAERLAWATGFTGSAGNAVVMADKAALVVDGRYTLQSQVQTDQNVVTPVKMEATSMEAWISANLKPGGVLGYDPWLHTADGVKRLDKAVTEAGGTLRAVTENPLDAAWEDQPAPPDARVVLYPEALAGEARAAKLARVQAALVKAKVGALIVSDPHNVCWLFNIRGTDVPHSPLALAYAVVRAEGPALLFLEPDRFANEDVLALVGSYPPSMVACFGRDVLEPIIARNAKGWGKVRIEASTGAAKLSTLVSAAGGVPDVGLDPIALMKAKKNAAELNGTRAAHLRDGAAMVRFLSWLAVEAPKGGVDQISAAARLEAERIATGALKEISFGSISAAGPNAALPHYRPTVATNRMLEEGIYLIDSGGQYEDGTTDITRTVAIGMPSAEMCDRYTRVLKGHIAIHRARFPVGASGAQLDTLARMPLWEAGLDFDHGTGHGVGVYLSVHEGPQRISKLGGQALEPGMILSNEPGYYREGHYGIRTENLVVVQEDKRAGDERAMLSFETLTFCPYDPKLIDVAMLTRDEREWVDNYHAQVRAKIGPLVEGAARDWLERVTGKL